MFMCSQFSSERKKNNFGLRRRMYTYLKRLNGNQNIHWITQKWTREVCIYHWWNNGILLVRGYWAVTRGNRFCIITDFLEWVIERIINVLNFYSATITLQEATPHVNTHFLIKLKMGHSGRQFGNTVVFLKSGSSARDYSPRHLYVNAAVSTIQ